MDAQTIMTELQTLGNPSVAALMQRNHGVDQPIFGVRIADLKKIQKRIKKDYQLALDLYATGNYDAMYFAGLIADDEKMTRSNLNQWATQAQAGALPEYTVAWVAAGSRHGWDMGLQWIDAKKLHVIRAGWATLGCIVALRPDSELDLKKLRQLIQRVEKTLPKVDSSLRSAMNLFLISVGCYVLPLSSLCRETGERIGPLSSGNPNNNCKIPYVPDYIDKVASRGSLGKKRKTVKC